MDRLGEEQTSWRISRPQSSGSQPQAAHTAVSHSGYLGSAMLICMQMARVITACMYHTGIDAFTQEVAYAARSLRDCKLQRVPEQVRGGKGCRSAE